MTITDALSSSFFDGWSRTVPLELCVLGNSESKGGSRLLEFGFGLPVMLQFLSSSGVSVQAGRALNARPICCCDGPVTVTFEGAWRLRLIWRIKIDGSDMIRRDMRTPLIVIMYKF